MQGNMQGNIHLDKKFILFASSKKNNQLKMKIGVIILVRYLFELQL